MEIIMENNNIEFEKYRQAKKKVDDIKGFYSHLVSFIAVNAFLLFINLKYSPEHLWFYWTTLGWGIGLLFHGLKVFDFSILGKNWEERKIREIMEKERNKS